jgi:hypothetical protein
MIIVLALAAQLNPSPLPMEMEAPVTLYSECVNRNFTADIERSWGSKGEKTEASGPKLINDAITACADTRFRAIALSERALEKARGFEEPKRRRAFVEDRFEQLDALLRWNVSPEGDPDNWSSDAQN